RARLAERRYFRIPASSFQFTSKHKLNRAFARFIRQNRVSRHLLNEVAGGRTEITQRTEGDVEADALGDFSVTAIPRTRLGIGHQIGEALIGIAKAYTVFHHDLFFKIIGAGAEHAPVLGELSGASECHFVAIVTEAVVRLSLNKGITRRERQGAAIVSKLYFGPTHFPRLFIETSAQRGGNATRAAHTDKTDIV